MIDKLTRMKLEGDKLYYEFDGETIQATHLRTTCWDQGVFCLEMDAPTKGEIISQDLTNEAAEWVRVVNGIRYPKMAEIAIKWNNEELEDGWYALD